MSSNQNQCDVQFDPESLTEVLDGLRVATWSIGQAIACTDPDMTDEAGHPMRSLNQEVGSLAEATWEVAAGLRAIAEAIREHGSRQA